MKTATLFTVLGLLLACAAGGRILPTATELASASGEPADVLQRGRGLYLRECSACHRIYWPDEYSPDEWRVIAPIMGERSGLDREEIDALSRFLAAASEASARRVDGVTGERRPKVRHP